IVHRDVKPQNVLIAPDGVAKVTDFGIARADSLSTMTATGAMMGTPYYMSPEQARGEQADASSDVYALGCVLYQMLTGEVPFDAGTPLAVLRQHIEQEPRPVGQLRTDTPRELSAIVERAMAKDPGRRFANGADMAHGLREAVFGLPPAPKTQQRPGDLLPPSQAPDEQDELQLKPARPGRFRSRVTRVVSLGLSVIGLGAIALVAIGVAEGRIGPGANDESPRVGVVQAPEGGVQAPEGGVQAPEGGVQAPLRVRTTTAANPVSMLTIGSATDAAPSSASTAGRVGSAAPAPVSVSSAVWIRRESFTFDPLMAVVVASDNTVHIGGDGGVFYRSADGGETWSASKSQIDCKIRDLQLVSDGMWTAIDDCDAGWIGTGESEPTWSRLAEMQRDELRGHSIYFVDSETGWIGGHEGELFATRDGGNTWDRFEVPTRSNLDAVFFADENRGWVGGPDGGLLSTSDGGATWERVRVDSDCRIEKFAARLPLIWAVGDCGAVIFSPDGGVSWENRSLQENIELTAVDFVDDQAAWVGGNVNGQGFPIVLETLDGGKSWHTAFIAKDIAAKVEDIVVEVSERGLIGWAVGTAGLLLQIVPEDGVPVASPSATTVLSPIAVQSNPPRAALPPKLTWDRQPEFTFDRLDAVDVVGPDRIYVGGDRGAIYRSMDGGFSWELPDPISRCPVQDLQFVTSQVGLVIDSCHPSDGGSLLRTEDGGAQWRRVSANLLDGEEVIAFYFVDTEHGWVAGQGGSLARTNDGGKTWERLDIATAAKLEAIYFVDRENGWLGGVDGSILQTDDGGLTWLRTSVPVIDCRVRDIEARLPIIWAVDDCRGVYLSVDSGQTWAARKIPFDGRLTALAFWDEQTVWIAGALDDRKWPVILESRDGGRSWEEVFRAEEPLGAIKDIVITETAGGPVGWAVGDGGLIVKLVRDTAS
ncbi:MAG: protein kinase, partial [Chloroflexi bacterium]|nr:protein kinase [Chloroflexota bacterium]